MIHRRRVETENKPTSLLIPLGKALNEIASNFEWLDFNNRWQVDSVA